MDAGQYIYLALSSHAAVNAICDSRIYPMVMPQDALTPAVTYQIITTDPGGSIQGDTTNLDRVRVQIDCWVERSEERFAYAVAKELAAAVRASLRDFRVVGEVPIVEDGVMQQNIPLEAWLRATPIDSSELYEDETQTYHISSDFYVWTKPWS